MPELANTDNMEDLTMSEEPVAHMETDINGESHADDAEEAEDNAAPATEIDDVESRKRKSAMDSLGSIEKEFAAFRDRLFDERLSQLTAEVELLEQPSPHHPELLAMLRCVDARRNEKIQHEQLHMQYKTRALEAISVANRAQAHAQFGQAVRHLREETLEQVGDEWYRIQQDRRKSEAGISEYTYLFSARRAQQVIQQTAYNAEVSILSGVAKYVGFPAAPPIHGVSASELDEDLRALGIKPSTESHATHPISSMERTILNPSTAARVKPAEADFLQRNAWANPTHPVSQQQRQQAQQQSGRTGSPLSRNLLATAHGPVAGRFSPSNTTPVHATGSAWLSKPPPHTREGIDKTRSPLSAHPMAGLNGGSPSPNEKVGTDQMHLTASIPTPNQPSIVNTASTGRFA